MFSVHHAVIREEVSQNMNKTKTPIKTGFTEAMPLAIAVATYGLSMVFSHNKPISV
jgi:hypothetical protein